MSESPGHHKYVKQLMAVPGNVELPGPPTLGNPCGIEQRSKPVESAHQNLVPCRLEGLGRAPKQVELVHDRRDPGQAHAEEEQGADGAKLGALEDWQERDQDRGNAEDGYEAQVEVAEERVAHEWVIDRRVKWGRNEGRDSRVVEPEHDVGESLGVAREEMACAAG